jgi:hypothetical protein
MLEEAYQKFVKNGQTVVQVKDENNMLFEIYFQLNNVAIGIQNL